MFTDFCVACSLTGVTASFLETKFGVRRRTARAWLSGRAVPPQEVSDWIFTLRNQFLVNANSAISYMKKMEEEHGQAQAIDIYLYDREELLIPGEHFETLELQNACAAFTGAVLEILGYRVEYVQA